jgi:GTP cyclohydrolase II
MSFTNPSATLPTKYGDFTIIIWPDENGKDSIALVTPQLDVSKPVLVRVHSECLTGDVFGSYRCDCGQQKQKALLKIAKSKNGIFIYLKQEGRGIGLSEKIRAYALQEQGYDTHEANILLGHDPDPREYSMVKKILNQLKVKDIKLMTNNPSKENSLREFGFTIVERIPLRMRSNKYNKKYIETKKIKFKHFNEGADNNYFYGISGIREADSIEAITQNIKDYNLDPFLRLEIGLYADKVTLTNEEEKKKIDSLFKLTMKYHPPLIPVLHYSFKNSKATDYKKEIMKIKKAFPLLKKLHLNDVITDHLEVLKFASRYFTVHFPISDEYFYLISDPKYSKLVRSRKVLTVLDSSKGKGVPESIASFEKKITLCLNNGINDIGVAGGFGPDNLETFFSLKNYFKINFSIDAETKLHKNGKLNNELVSVYLDQLLHPEANLQ